MSKQIQFKVTEAMFKAIERHCKEKGLSRTAWFKKANEEWLGWLERGGKERFRPRTAPSTGISKGVYIDLDLKERLEQIVPNAPLTDIYWSMIVWYSLEHNFFERPEDLTDSIMRISFEPEQAKLIEHLIETGPYESRNEFWLKALTRWLKKRATHKGPFLDYFMVPWRGGDDDTNLTEINIHVPTHLHAHAQEVAEKDGVMLNVLYYNMVIDHLDADIEEVSAITLDDLQQG